MRWCFARRFICSLARACALRINVTPAGEPHLSSNICPASVVGNQYLFKRKGLFCLNTAAVSSAVYRARIIFRSPVGLFRYTRFAAALRRADCVYGKARKRARHAINTWMNGHNNSLFLCGGRNFNTSIRLLHAARIRDRVIGE